MTRSSRMVALAAGTAMIALQSAPAVAEGTNAGTSIRNTATIDYRVGGVNQTAVTASDTFSVDRKVNFVISRVPDVTTTVVPGQSGAVIAFDVTNLSNDTIDLALAAAQASGDNFDADNVTIFVGAANSTFNGTQNQTNLIDEIAEDATVRVFVVSNIPINRRNADVANLTLSATARSGNTPGAQGGVITTTTGPDTDDVETVLADGAGPDDGVRDGIVTARGSYTVTAATLAVNKASRVVSDPINNTADPKAIPGALVEYCIAVSNAAGSAEASNVIVTDVLPADLTYVGAFGIWVDGALDGSGNCTGGVAGGSIAARSISAPLSDVAAGQTRTVYFRATIN